MAQYYKNKILNVYTVSASPVGFWRKCIKFLPYNVGQKIQLEVTVESKRERGLSWMDLTYFEFVEITPGGQRKTIKVDETKIFLDKRNKHKGIIYPLDTSPISQEGVTEWQLVSQPFNDEILLFIDNTVFLHSSKDGMRYIFAVISFVTGVATGIILKWLTQ
jgi:hypothetical protein